MRLKAPKLPRRDFMKSVAKKAPAWAVLFSMLKPSKLFGASDSDYVAEDHDYAMGIDIHKCIGCGRCADACKTENKVPREKHYFRTWIERYIMKNSGDTIVDSPNGGIDGFPPVNDDIDVLKMFFVPKLCNHCKNAPCVQVCPVGATFTSPDGVVLVDESYCVGCRYCIQACPYGARYLHPEKMTADKCTFCYHRIRKGHLPACVEVCPTQARVFGELGKQSSPLRRFMKFNDVNVLKPGLNTEPKVFYSGINGEVR